MDEQTINTAIEELRKARRVNAKSTAEIITYLIGILDEADNAKMHTGYWIEIGSRYQDAIKILQEIRAILEAD